MIREATTLPSGGTLERDVCVVGAGAAGITLALELARLRRSVCLLEGGGAQAEGSSQALYAGPPPTGFLARRAGYLAESRLRFLGGTTNHWTGACAPLDAIDFTQRHWIPHSGWPFGRDELEPWYRRAAPLVEIRPLDYDPAALGRRPLALGERSGVETALTHMSPPTRFGSVYRQRLAESQRVELVLHGNAVEVVADANGARIEAIQATNLAGHRFRVRAKAYVLAAGGLENARLLLGSNRVVRSGLGNTHDLVGRYFMDHMYSRERIAEIVFQDGPRALSLYLQRLHEPLAGAQVRGVFRLSDALQRQHGLLNAQFGLVAASLRPGSMAQDLAALYDGLDPTAGGAPPDAGHAYAFVELGSEVAPDPRNRVILGDELDALGLRRPRLHLELSPLDRRSLEQSVRVFARELGRTLRARVRVSLTPRNPWRGLLPGAHHIGTTRMHRDPAQGVVDADARVHGLRNLYVAGSSVFPTSGRPNPTYTLLALALRLANHLGEVLEKA